LTAAGGHPDLHLVEAPLRIEAARALQSTLALAPVEGTWRVAVIPEIETASIGAANSLLKLLEEPPGHAVLLLSASAIEAVLPTIRSRARQMRLRPLPPTIAGEALEQGWQVEPEQARRLARWCGGCLGSALEILEDEDALAGREAWLDQLETVLGEGTAARLGLAASLARDRDALPAGLVLWNGWWRDALLLGLGVDDGLLVHEERRVALGMAAAALDTRSCVAAVRAVERALAALAAHANPQLTLECLLLELPHIPIPAARAA
jgi:DNA polymerase-3 subunit delta'